MKLPAGTFHFPRQVLLIEIVRRCVFLDCQAKNRISLTKSEAIQYRGFECGTCERWNDDELDLASLPDQWPQ